MQSALSSLPEHLVCDADMSLEWWKSLRSNSIVRQPYTHIFSHFDLGVIAALDKQRKQMENKFLTNAKVELGKSVSLHCLIFLHSSD